MTSESRRRRALILGFCAITAFLAVVSILSVSGMGDAPPWTGHWGFNRSPAPFGIVITGIDPAGPAAAAGLHAGDAVDLRDVPLHERYWLSQRALNGGTVALPIRRNGGLERISVTPTPIATLGGGSWRQRWILSFSFYSVPLLVIWLTLFAAIMASRGGHIRRARLLALALVTYAAHLCIAESRLWTTPWLWENVLSDLFGRVMLPVSAAFSVALASTFGLPLSQLRRSVQYGSYALLSVAGGLALFAGLGFITLWFDWNAPIFSARYLHSLIYFLPVLCIALAIAASPSTERQRSVWMLVPLGTLFVIGLFIELSSPALPSSYAFTNIVADVRTLIFLLVPIALTYAVLNRRVLDIAFVLNRAAVFAGVSVILVGTFVLVEWLLAGWLQNTSHTTNIVFSAALALSLGLSIRYVHARVEHVVDNIFFRKRHEDERALRAFAREAAYITELPVLIRRTESAVERSTDASTVKVVLHDGNGCYGDVSENDPALVTLRASHRVLDLQGVDTRLRGDFAYPMVARGRLLGALVLGRKRSEESYAPDEQAAIEQLADGVASAVDLLSLGSASRDDAVLDGIRAIQRSIAEIGERLG